MSSFRVLSLLSTDLVLSVNRSPNFVRINRLRETNSDERFGLSFVVGIISFLFRYNFLSFFFFWLLVISEAERSPVLLLKCLLFTMDFA